MKSFRKNFAVAEFWVCSNDKLSDFYASSWQRNDSPVPLLCVRLVLAALSTAVLVWSLVEAPNPYWLIYLTNWGLLLVWLMTMNGLLISLLAVCRKIPVADPEELPWFVSSYWLLFNISVSLAIMITTLYWVLLFDPAVSDTGSRMFWLDVMTHGFNSVVVVCELLVARTPLRLLHFYQPLGLGLWYAAFSAIYYATGGTDALGNAYIYAVLDWSQAGQAGAIVGASAGGMLAIHGAAWAAAQCRGRLSAALRTTSHDLPYTPESASVRSGPV